MTLEQTTLFSSISGILGVKSRAALAIYSPAKIRRRARDAGHDYDWSEVKSMCAEAKKEYNDLRIMEKKLFTRASPLLPAAVRLGLEHPDASLMDYEEWFGRETIYAGPGDVSSMFSPAAYLTELYRNARSLYPETSEWHIDNRRPDLKNLLLSQDNMNREVTALSLSNEILLEKMRSELTADPEKVDNISDDAVMQTLSTHLTSSSTPFHLHHSRLRQVCRQKDPEFRQMLASPKVTGNLSGPTLAGVYYDISPALYRLLTDDITEKNAEAKFKQYFGENVHPVHLQNPQFLRRWYGLTDDETRLFSISAGAESENAEYNGNSLKTMAGGVGYEITYVKGEVDDSDIDICRIYPLGGTTWKMDFRRTMDTPYPHAEFFIDRAKTDTKIVITSAQFGDARFIKGKVYSAEFHWPDSSDISTTTSLIKISKDGNSNWWNYSFTFTIQRHTYHAYFLKLNKAIRLYKATGLPLRVLEDIVNSVNPDQISDETLTLLFRTALLMKHYGVSHEEALVMSKGLISQAPHAGEKSQFDRLFNDPALTESAFYPEIIPSVILLPDDASHADIKAALKRAFYTDDDGMSALLKIYNASGTEHRFYLRLKDISGMYAVSLWARVLSLSPRELLQLLTVTGLPPVLGEQPVSEWNALFVRAAAVVDWLRARGWTVLDMVLMTRDVAGIPSGSEIAGLLDSLRAAAVAADLPENPQFDHYASPLVPPLAAALNLPGDVLTRAILKWADGAATGGMTLAKFRETLVKETPGDDDISALSAFACGLAQMALIVHATDVTPDALALFVENPSRLSAVKDEGSPLERSADVVMALGEFTKWLRTLPDLASVIISDLAKGGVTPAHLAQAAGLPENVITQAAAEAERYGGVVSENNVASWQEISLVLEWVSLSRTFDVMPSDIGRLIALEYRSNSEDDWETWKRVADTFVAALPAAAQKVLQENIADGLSGALSGWLLAQQAFASLGVSSRETLFSYLLSDNLNGPQVKTSRLAEAISSIQILIHRTLSLASTTQEGNDVVREALEDQFFTDWLLWNARYSTWAGGQKLMYYPENYIDPTMRLGQTQMMDDMLQVLGQAQINTDTVGDAFMGYLTGFEEVANLETISAYHDSTNSDEGKTWFVGRNQITPPEYWWRTLDEDKRGPGGEPPANAWTGWTKITAAPQTYGTLIRPVVYKKRLYLGWVERNRYVTARNEKGEEIAWEHRWELKISWLRYDGGWSQPAVYTYPSLVTDALEKLLKDAGPEGVNGLSLYLSVWPEKQQMVAGIYIHAGKDNVPESSFKGHIIINEDMTFEQVNFLDKVWQNFQLTLDFNGTRRVLTPFVPIPDPIPEKPPLQLKVDKELTGASGIPAGFSRFDYSNLNVSVTEIDTNNSTYKIKMGLTQIVGRSESKANRALLLLLDLHPDVKRMTTPIRAICGSNSLNKLAGIWAYQEGNYVKCKMIIVPRTPPFTHIISKDYPLIDKTTSTGEKYQHVEFQFEGKMDDVNPEKVFSMFASTWSGGIPFSLRLLLSNVGTLITSNIIPLTYSLIKDTVPKGNITSNITQEGSDSTFDGYSAGRDFNFSDGAEEYTWPQTVYPKSNKKFNFSGNEVLHTIELSCGAGIKRTWKLRVFKDPETKALTASVTNVIDTIGMMDTNGQSARYLEHRGTRTRLNTLFARQLTEKAASGIDAILNFSTQSLSEPPLYRQSATINVGKYDETKHKDGKFSLYYVSLYGDRDYHLAFNGKIDKTAEKSSFEVPLPDKFLSTGVEDHNTLWLAGAWGGGPPSSTYKEFYSLYFDRTTGLYTIDITNKIPGTESATLNAISSGVMDFSGANALYFWELFYYTPMMVMQRFLQEERFDLAELWLKYVFSPSGYIVHGESDPRMWNVRPLKEDTSWNDDPLVSYDPDAVAQNDPMHYKLNAFMRLLDITIGKGDTAYRKLERDTLAEAKVWYSRALSLLGEKPWAGDGSAWLDPILGSAADDTVLAGRIDALSQMAEGLRRDGNVPVATTNNTLFWPEVNEVMLGYWDTLRIRLYNLRHNLTIDGQPLNLPLFAAPADPKALLAAAVAAEEGAGSGLPTVSYIPALRFTPMLESARSMASQLIQFGSTMQQILINQDGEALSELLNTQGAALAASSLSLQKQTLLELAAERVTLERSIDTATTRRNHYEQLYQENINARENHAMNLITTSETMSAAIKPLYVAGAIAGIAPNIFGLANGGMKYEGPLNAAGIGLEIAANALHIAGSRIQQEESYRRRREEWDIQYRTAEKEVQGLEAQLDALSVRETSAALQIAHMETQSNHAEAQLALFQGKYTSKAMYSWLRGRLATIFYQYYDLTASLCLMAQRALQWEKDDHTSYLKTGTWNGAWAGLMAGEGLMLSLAQMEMAWMKHQKRELEVTRTVSLAAFFKERLDNKTLPEAISELLTETSPEFGEGLNKLRLDDADGEHILSVHFSLADVNAAPDYNSKTLRVRSIAVTLPALLGPYQNVRARLRTNAGELPAGCNESAISHAMQDNGLFVNDGSGDPRWGARWLPFEGLDVNNEDGMTLSFADATGGQKALLESLNDIILHIQFTVR